MRISPAINGLLGQTEAFLICKRLFPSPLQPWLGLLWHQWQRLLGSSLLMHLIYHETSISLHSSILFPVSLKMALIKICDNFQVTTAPKSSTKVPADTSVFVPVLPETVPMFAQVWIRKYSSEVELFFFLQVPDVVVAPRQETDGSQKVQISQVNIFQSWSFHFKDIFLLLPLAQWYKNVSFLSGSSWICPILRNRLCAPWSELGHQFHITS